MIARKDGRRTDQLRPVFFEPNFHRKNCTLVGFGQTKVICYASIEEKVPPWLVGASQGWLTAEYSMLPSSALPRQPREKSQGGRATEIQRLIGRALRASLDLSALPPITIRIDCDVLTADGGTRTASICGAFVSLAYLIYQERLRLDKMPLKRQVAAVSAGLVGDDVLIDLTYEEDSTCDVDANIVMASDGKLVDITASAEKRNFTLLQLQKMIALAQKAIEKIFEEQKRVIPSGLVLE